MQEYEHSTTQQAPKHTKTQNACVSFDRSVGDHLFGEIDRYPSLAETLEPVPGSSGSSARLSGTSDASDASDASAVFCVGISEILDLKCVQIPSNSIFEADEEDIELAGFNTWHQKTTSFNI